MTTPLPELPVAPLNRRKAPGGRLGMPHYVRDMLALAAYAQGQGVDVVGRFAPDLSEPDYYDPSW